MMQLLQRLERMADVIIFDTPPVLAVTDSVVLSKRTDGVILVVRSKSTRRDAVKEAVERLNKVGATLIGTIVNGVAGGTKDGYHYSHYSHSSPNQDKQSDSSTLRRWWQRLALSK